MYHGHKWSVSASSDYSRSKRKISVGISESHNITRTVHFISFFFSQTQPEERLHLNDITWDISSLHQQLVSPWQWWGISSSLSIHFTGKQTDFWQLVYYRNLLQDYIRQINTSLPNIIHTQSLMYTETLTDHNKTHKDMQYFFIHL